MVIDYSNCSKVYKINKYLGKNPSSTQNQKE